MATTTMATIWPLLDVITGDGDGDGEGGVGGVEGVQEIAW